MIALIRDLEQLFRDHKIRVATVKIQGEAAIDNIGDAIFEGAVYRPTIVIANKADLPGPRRN